MAMNAKLELMPVRMNERAPKSAAAAGAGGKAVLDEWFETTVRARMGGNCFLVRFADDFVMGYAFKGDAEKVFRVLPKRFERFGLSIHPEKSRLVQFSRPYWRQGKGPGTFAFLGFDHYWDKTRNGGWTIKRKTQGKRLRRFLSGLHEWCRVNRHLNIVEQYQTLKSKLRGHYQYYGENRLNKFTDGWTSLPGVRHTECATGNSGITRPGSTRSGVVGAIRPPQRPEPTSSRT